MPNPRFYRPTWAEINLTSLEHNFKQVKRLVLPGVKIMPTVKADAYGHGLIPVAKKLASCGADYLGVASIDEGIKLRQAGINLPILVMGLILESDSQPLFEYNLTATVSSLEFCRALSRKAIKAVKPAKIHIKVDTGMGRIGVLYKDALETIKQIARLKFLKIEGIFTHFPLADTDKDFTLYQISRFDHLIESLEEAGIKIPLVHSANSLGVINYKKSHFNLVRPGIMIYGLNPVRAKGSLREPASNGVNLKPVLVLKTRVIYLKKVPKGCGISYGHSYITKKTVNIVTLPIGYGDGYPRNLSGFGPVLIGGRRFKIIGRVCMDQVMVDIGSAKVKIGDEAVLIGSQKGQRITTEELATFSGTIPYEIVCGLGSRIVRVYI